MSKLRDAIALAPEFVGVDGPNSKRWAKTLLDQFDADASGLSKEFDLQDGESVDDRFDILRGLYMAKGAIPERVDFFIGLMLLAGYAYAIHKGRVELASERDSLVDFLSPIEAENAKMAKVLSVEQASTLTVWA